MKYLLIDCGCAECSWGEYPLIESEVFNSLDEAKATIDDFENWKPHPQGGWYLNGSASGIWLVALEDLLKPKEVISAVNS